MKQLGDFLRRLIQDMGFEGPLADQRVMELWPEVVGEKIAEMTEPDRVENGVLYVRVPSSVWRNELSLQREKILEKYHEFGGCRHLREIRFI